MLSIGKIVGPDCGHVRGNPFGVGNFREPGWGGAGSAEEPSITQSGSERGSDGS